MGKYRYSIQDVHAKTGLSRNAVSNLYNDKARRIDFETLEKLCRLFKCTVSDLIEFVDNEEACGEVIDGDTFRCIRMEKDL